MILQKQSFDAAVHDSCGRKLTYSHWIFFLSSTSVNGIKKEILAGINLVLKSETSLTWNLNLVASGHYGVYFYVIAYLQTIVVGNSVALNIIA